MSGIRFNHGQPTGETKTMAHPNTTPSNGGNSNGGSGQPAGEPQRTGDLTSLVRHVAMDARRPKLQPLRLNDSDSRDTVLVVPTGYEVKSVKPLLDEYRTRPQLRAGTTELHDLASFIAWTNRHKDVGSVIYASNGSEPKLVAVIDHDDSGPEIGHLEGEGESGSARFMRHRGLYKFPMSREWQEWMAVHRKPLGTAQFAEFLERRIGDVVPPPYVVDDVTGETRFASADPEIRKLAEMLGKKFASATDLAKLMRGIEINIDSKAVSRIDRDTGEHHIEYAEANGQGVDRVKPPNAFLIAIPVLDNGQPFLIAVHLRYRPSSGTINWTMELHQPERVFEEVFKAALEEVLSETGLAPLRGLAPAAR